MSAFVVLCTAPTRAEAKKIARTLVQEHLAACVNCLPCVRSHYWWKGKTASASEILLLIKTTRARLPALKRRLLALHSYEVPEVLALPVAAGSAAYLRWLAASTRPLQ